MRVPRKTHAPLTFPGTLSTAGHSDQLSAIYIVHRGAALHAGSSDVSVVTSSELQLYFPQKSVGHAQEKLPLAIIRQSKKKYVPKAPKFLSELDLTKTNIQLTDFMAEKDPSEMFDKYTVIAAWFKQHYNTHEVSQNHIFTAFKHLGWQSQLPEDVGSPSRALKSQKNWFEKGSGKGLYKMNWSGESAVLKMGASK